MPTPAKGLGRTEEAMNVESNVAKFQEKYTNIKTEIGKIFVGQEDVVESILKVIFSGGHALLEGVPGLGKTLLVRTIAQTCSLVFKRIQFTPDLMPADIIGTNMIMQDDSGKKEFQFQYGPVFAQILLADEINRATPKTQSALLEAMQEKSVTSGGKTYRLKEPFFVLATQNPIEMEGTYPLPEAQVDRFIAKVYIEYPKQSELDAILDQTTSSKSPQVSKVLSAEEIIQMRQLAREVPIASHVRDLVTRLVYATHPAGQSAPEMVKKYVRYGSSPRGGQSLILMSKVSAMIQGRYNVSEKDIIDNLLTCLRHRIILSFEGEAEGIRHDDILSEVQKLVQ